MTRIRRERLKPEFATGYELVDGTARIFAMNLLRHGMGSYDGESLTEVRDFLTSDSGDQWSVILSNPPF